MPERPRSLCVPRVLCSHSKRIRDFEVKSGKAKDIKLETIWSKSLSAFSNSDGGVLIFGLDAPQNQITGLSLVDNAVNFSGWLLQQLPNAIEPQLSGVQIEPITQPGKIDGFVVCYIPPSPWRPHRAKFCNGYYYIRSGDNSFEAGPSILRSLFSPTSVARFEITGRVQKQTDGRAVQIHLTIWLHNTGSATAHDVFVVPNLGPDTPAPAFEGNSWSYFNTALSRLGGYQFKRPLHPGETVVLLAQKAGYISENGKLTLNWKEPDFSFQLFAANQTPVTLSRKFLLEDYIDHSFNFQP